MIVELLTEHHLEFLSLKGGCRVSSQSTLVKMSDCWKSHALAHYCLTSCSPLCQSKWLIPITVAAQIGTALDLGSNGC